MPPCQRCGLGKRSGNGRGWCSNQACREAERKEKEEQQQVAKRQRQLAREDQGAGRRGPRPSEAALVEQEAKRLRQKEREEQAAGRRGPRPSEAALVEQEAKRLRQEERAEKGAGERGPCPGEGAGGRPMDTEEARAEKLEILRGPPFFRDDNFEAVKESYKKFLRAWARFGLSKACAECSTLTPGKYCCLSRTMQKQACKNCREKTTSYKLPPLPPIPPTLAALSYLERRLLAMAKVDQTLIDKLPAGGPSAQWGRMYVVPHDEPSLCNVLEGAELREDGAVYVEGVQGMLASTARLQHLQAALQTLKAQHQAYGDSAAVDAALATMARILAQLPAALPDDHEEDEGTDEQLEVTYLMPRDPGIPKADQSALHELRRKARVTMDNIDTMLFPHLFPTGQHGYRQGEYKKFSEYARKRLLGADGRFEQDPAYIMWLLEEHMKKRLSGNVNVRMKGQVAPQFNSRYEDMSRKIFTALRDLPSTQPYFYTKRGVALGMYEQLGTPEFFLTLTCHARQPAILAAVITAKLLRQHGEADEDDVTKILYAYQADEDYKWNGETATQLCNSMPAIVARQFMHSLRQLLHWLGADAEDGPQDNAEGADEQDRPGDDLGGGQEDGDGTAAPAMGQDGQPHRVKQDKPPFKVLDYVIRIEWQKRGYPHAHILLWTDVPDVTGRRRPEQTAEGEASEEAQQELDWSDDEVRLRAMPTCAEDLSDKYICTKSANRWLKDERHEPGDRVVMAKLATMMEHTCGPYCGKYTLGSCRFGFPRAAEQRTRWRTAQEQFASRWKSSLAARRHQDDGFVGQYNNAILRFWRASMDLQVVCELNCASKYILGYCFKSEEDIQAKKRVDNIVQGFLQDAWRVDLSTNDVYKAAHAATQGRTTSTFEAAHYLLGYPGVMFSRDNQWVQVGPPSTWTLSVPQVDEQEALEDPAAYTAKQQEGGRGMPVAQRWYQQLQKHFPDAEVKVPVEGSAPVCARVDEISFFDFVAGFRFGGPAFNPDKVVPRKRPAIVGHRNYSPDLHPEEFYYSKLLLYTRWVEPGDWLEEADGSSHAAAFHRIAMDREHHPNFLQSVCFPKLDGTVQAARELQAVQAVMFLKAKLDNATWTHTRAEEHNYQDSMRIMQALKERHGDDIEFMAPDNVPTGPATDIFAPVEGGEARKGQNTVILCVSKR